VGLLTDSPCVEEIVEERNSIDRHPLFVVELITLLRSALPKNRLALTPLRSCSPPNALSAPMFVGELRAEVPGRSLKAFLIPGRMHTIAPQANKSTGCRFF
jgi:hypothetical protein